MLLLRDATLRHLVALRRSPSYGALLDVLEALCEVEETRLLQLDRSAGATDSQVLSAQDQARACRALFEKLQLECEEQVAALQTPANEGEGDGNGHPGN